MRVLAPEVAVTTLRIARTIRPLTRHTAFRLLPDDL